MLAEQLGASVTTTVGARGAIPDDHPQALVAAGFGAISAQADADVVLAVGTRFGELSFWGRAPMWGERDRQKVIQIDADPSSIGLNVPVAVGCVADARVALAQVLGSLREAARPRELHPGIAEYRAAQDAWIASSDAEASSESMPIHPQRLARQVREFFPREAFVVVDGGNAALWSVREARVYDPRSFLWAAGMGHLGPGLPFALAAKMAFPERPVFVLHGDGSFMMLPQELETARRLGLPVVDVIFNDRAWGMIKAGQGALFEGRSVGVDFTDVRYDELARAMGCFGERVEDPDEIGPALKRATDSGLPAVLDVMIDAEANLTPMELQVLTGLWLEGCV
jgi:acetolactate synthase-1/2/3 large subunit